MFDAPTKEVLANEFYKDLWRSPNYFSPHPNGLEKQRLQVVTEFLKRVYGPKEDSKPRKLRLLDLGCGRGWLRPFLEEWGQVTSVEPVASAVELAQGFFPGAEIILGDASTLLARGLKESFDVIVSVDVFEHVESHAAFLRFATQLLRRGGYLILTTPPKELYPHFCKIVPREQQQPVENWIARRDLIKIAKNEGLTLLDEDRIYEIFSHCGIWRLLNSVKLNGVVGRIPGMRSAWQWYKMRYALGYCCLLKKPFPKGLR